MPKRKTENVRQKRFMKEYAKSGNAVQSAKRAGYGNTYGSSAVQGHRLLKNAKYHGLTLEDLNDEWLSGKIAELANDKNKSVQARMVELVAKISGKLKENSQNVSIFTGIEEKIASKIASREHNTNNSK